MCVALFSRSACEFMVWGALASISCTTTVAAELPGSAPQGRSQLEASERNLARRLSTRFSNTDDFPITGVRYIPHLVGEPYPHPESSPWGYYGSAYTQMHQRDLPLIGRTLGADTVSLRPWTSMGMEYQHQQFFSHVERAGISKVIPTFHLAKYYADMLRQGLERPRTDPASAFAVDFRLFAASVTKDVLQSVKMVAWTVDLSLDLKDLLPLVGKECEYSLVNLNKNFRAYRVLLNAIQEWVYPKENITSVAPVLQSTPFLVPLDVSRAVPAYAAALKVLIECMSRSSESGGWSDIFAYSGQDKGPRNRWLFSFAVPPDSSFDFRHDLANISRWIADPTPERPNGTSAIIMAGTQAIKAGEANPINSVNLLQDSAVDNGRYAALHGMYQQVSTETGNLDGFIYDEWMDDWDRGDRGPFFLATYNLPLMVDNCDTGGRFSHDIEQCSRSVGGGARVFPEYFGLASISSRLGQHCMQPRFDRHLFDISASLPNESMQLLMSVNAQPAFDQNLCSFMLPSIPWVLLSLACLSVVTVGQVTRLLAKWVCWDQRKNQEGENSNEQGAQAEQGQAGQEDVEPKHGNTVINPTEQRLSGEHRFELQSTRFNCDIDAAWWLWTHVSAQTVILERQVEAEAKATRAVRVRTSRRTGGSDDHEEFSDDLAIAMRVIHRRTLEGFAAWCLYIAGVTKRSLCGRGISIEQLQYCAKSIEENAARPLPQLFAEALLLRVMESLGEQILHCPERISFLFFGIMQAAGGFEDIGPMTFCIDLDELQDGLLQMNHHSNPYVRKKMPSGKWELGLNFDDINECGIQCRDTIVKTYKEPSSAMVILDFMLCYRIPIMLKLYALGVAGYIYLDSGMGDDISTRHNGSLFAPKWLRINYIQYTALFDGALWVAIEVVLLLYTLWQRWPSLTYKSPGVPGLRWTTQHVLNLVVSALGAKYVYGTSSFVRKPWECSQQDLGHVCSDEERKLDQFLSALIYWLMRCVILVLMNSKHVPIFLYGTPESKVREGTGRGCLRTWAVDLRVNLAWLFMLGACIFIEVTLLLPTMKGLDWSSTCGWNVLGTVTGLPIQEGVCTDPEQAFTFGCVTCVSSVAAGWMLVILGSMVDLYFVFYWTSAVVGSIMGHRRQLNDLKNTSWPIDLRPERGREAQLFRRTFGPGWQQIWRMMVKSLCDESLLSPKQATALVQSANISMDGQPPLSRREKDKDKKKLIDLQQFPQLAAERLTFFFQSLKWIENDQPRHHMWFHSETDALTGTNFDPGTVPSLTQIIPVYTETIIPSVDFLRAGADPEDAKNSVPSPDDHPGLGDLTVPPKGDGVNTNLAFMISQFPDEWVFLAMRLQQEGWIERVDSQQLYQSFMKMRLNARSVFEVRLWAAMRMQSVLRTIIGALQYGRALASLPKIKEHYLQQRYARPGLRTAEDHAEVILAHQTFGNKAGNAENDEAVRLIFEKYCDEVLYLVFDLNEGSNVDVRAMVQAHLLEKGGHGMTAFTEASVKCRWDRERNGLTVVEVLPRMFPLRLGQGDYRTQGKAGNQLNALRFAQGHYVQALDCNMGAFIGECFKIPYVLRAFMPLDQEDRSAPRCRFLGFREHIYAQREGTVGRCQASAEWTFGTIYQRFLSGMAMRMHYGHPDFLDAFWARNRGGMSKGSAVVNLSEDIFAGFNVRMREEASPHIDALEFEKGREATINAASGFFAKIAGGSVSIIRSRDNHLICERIGLLHSLSYYFASVAFYTSNLIVDMSIYLYVAVFILFTLAGLGPGKLSALGSTFSTEWIISMGFVSVLPQLCEKILENGAMSAAKDVARNLFSSTLFFIFQNKNIASAVVEGVKTGIARYLGTGRPPANQHQTWKDIYICYWKSHYNPAMTLAFGYLIYSALAMQNRSDGKLPMVLVVISFVAWIIGPIVFSPLHRWGLIAQDLQEFNNFIVGGAGTVEADIPEVLSRGKQGRVRSLYECGLAEELCVWSEQAFLTLILGFLGQVVGAVCLAFALPAEILDYLPAYLLLLSLSWVLVFGYFSAGLNNVFLVLSFLVWAVALPLAHLILGSRFDSPTVLIRMPEYLISLAVSLYLLSLAKSAVLIFCRAALCVFPCTSGERATRRLHECIRICFLYFGTHQLHMVKAYIIMFCNLVVAGILTTVDRLCSAHTWFLLNSELTRTKHGERYMEKKATFYEQDGTHNFAWDFWSSDSESDNDSRLHDHDDGSCV